MTVLQPLAVTGLLLLAVTWIGYPLVVAALSRLRHQPSGEWPEGLPAATVLIATRDGGNAVRARVENCLASEYPPDRLDVVVALDSAGAGVPSELAGMDRVRLVRADAPGGKGCALNAGMREVTSEIVVFADTHQRFEPDTIRRLVLALADSRLGAVSGQLEIDRGSAVLARLYWRYERWLRRNEARLHSVPGVTGAVYAMRARLWMPLPPGVLLDDVYAPMTLLLRGYRVGMDPAARAIELRPSEPLSEYRRKVRTLTGVIQICAWLPDVLKPWKNPIWTQFVVHKLFRMLSPIAVLPGVLWLLAVVLMLPPLQLAAVCSVTVVLAVWIGRGRHHRARQLRDLLVESTLLPAAVVMASMNGLRGHWKVWNG